MGSIRQALKEVGLKINGKEPTGKLISERIRNIGDEYTPQIALDVVAYTGDEDLFGHTVDELQKDVAVENGVVSGELYYVAGFDPELNHFLVLQASANLEGATITGQIINGTSGPATLDPDGIIMFKLDPTKEQSLRFVVSKDNVARTYNFTLDVTFDEAQ